MKKVCLLFGLLLSLLLVNVVYAEGPYFHDFDTEKFDYLYATLNVEYKGGYLVVDNDYNSSAASIQIYDATGKKIKDKTLGNKIVDEVKVIGENIYLLYENRNGTRMIGLYDSSLTLQESIDLESDIWYYEGYYDGMDYLKEKDGKLFIIVDWDDNDDLVIAKLPKDLSDKELITVPYSQVDNYYPEYESYDKIRSLHEDEYIDNVYSGTRNGYIAAGYIDRTDCQELPTTNGKSQNNIQRERQACEKIYFELINPSGNSKWRKALGAKYEYVYEARFIDDYVVAIASTETGSSILIYDMNGDLVQEIKTDSSFERIVDTENGFIIAKNTCGYALGAWFYTPNPQSKSKSLNGPRVKYTYSNDSCCHTALLVGTSKDKQGEDACESYHEVYYVYRHVVPKVTTGKGKIEVVDKQKPGKPVEFVITPDEGYVLGKVKVTDAAGNVVVFTSNRFTMPSADVTIEVEFLVANANTADIAIIGISIITVLAAIIGVTQYKKFKEVK